MRRPRGRGCRGARRRRRRCGSGRRSPSGSRSRRPARRAGCGTGPGRRTAASRPRRAAGPRRCGGRRGTGSPGTGRRPVTPAPRARPRIDCSSSTVSNTRAAPARFEQAAGDAVDAALGRHVLAEDQQLGVAGQQVGQRAVDRLGQRQRAFGLGQRAVEERGPPLGDGGTSLPRNDLRPGGAAPAAP